MKSKRIEAGRYLVTDTRVGSFMVWREAEENADADCPRRWFVNYEPDTLDETLYTEGFQTKWEAVAWLTREIEHGEWWCRKCETRTDTNLLLGGMCETCRGLR